MKNFDLKIDRGKRYVIACSFGPDSMALLSTLIKQNFDVIVAHVNYHHREESLFEEIELKKYCKAAGVKLEILDLKNENVTGNFEAWAREKRYNFFHHVVTKYNADEVLIAHHQDDLIETYIMQKRRGIYVKTWGISEKTTIFDVVVRRPLLNYKKEELLEYCKENKIPYSIDKTNLTNDYERNKIRHEIIEKLTDAERQELLNKIASEKPKKFIKKSQWDLEEFLTLNYDDFIGLLDNAMAITKSRRNISKKFYLEIMEKCAGEKANIEINMTCNLSICKSYNKVYLIDKRKIKNYLITLEQPGTINEYIFDIDFTCGTTDRGIKKEDYPIMITNLESNEVIAIQNFKKTAKRFFIDCKTPIFLRKVWPCVRNKDGKIVYVPRYRENFQEKHKSRFIINTEKLLVNFLGAEEKDE